MEEQFKICTKCNRLLPFDNFRWRNKAQNKKHSHCKECEKEADRRHYQNSIERQNAVKTRTQQQKQENVNYIIFKKQHGCRKCGYNNCLEALDFHHIDPTLKDNTIAHMIKSSSLESLSKEIDKCIVLCANCHREFHHLEKVQGINLEQFLDGLLAEKD